MRPQLSVVYTCKKCTLVFRKEYFYATYMPKLKCSCGNKKGFSMGGVNLGKPEDPPTRMEL